MSMLRLSIDPRRFPTLRARLRLLALGYVVKTAAFGVAWYFIPDLPQRLLGLGTAAWVWLAD